jgi:alpha-glucosidase
VLDLPDAVREDPVWFRSGGKELGRDGCRVPLPWSGSAPPFGFTTSDHTWLADQSADPESTLSLYRAALAIRRTAFTGGLTWPDSPPHVLAFARDDG